MKEKALKKLSRAELLELLLEQIRKNEELQTELDEVRQALEQKKLKMDEAGNIAEAALSLNGVFETAQAAADQYLQNIQLMESLARESCRLLEQVTVEKCRKQLQETGINTEEVWKEIRGEVVENTVRAARITDKTGSRCAVTARNNND